MRRDPHGLIEFSRVDSSSGNRVSKVFSLGVAVVFLVLAGCGSSNKDATRQQRESTPAEPKADTAPEYAVQELPGGTVAGRVLLNGKTPPARKIIVSQDPSACGSQREVFPVRVEKGGVVDAVVSIEEVRRGKPFAFPAALLGQKRCTYLPHIVLMQPGELRIETSDPIPHNVHTYAQNNREYNETMNPIRRALSLNFPRPDRVIVRCDLHGWMQAFVVIARSPYYAVTTEGGKFKLEGVPTGHYRLKLWDQTLGETEQEINVEAGKTTHVDFTLGLRAALPAAGE